MGVVDPVRASEQPPFTVKRSLQEALRQQREGAGLSVERLASSAGIAVQRLLEIEGGVAPTTSEIANLGNALTVDPASLWRGEVSSTRTTARFRAPSGIAALSEVDARLLGQAAEVGRIASHLARVLGMLPSAVVAARNVRGIDPWPEPWEQGYRLGAAARRLLAPEKKPIVSVAGLLEQLGVHVAEVSFETPEILAASLYEPGSTPVVLLNKTAQRGKSKLARRAVLAHELCHLLHDGGEQDLLTLVSRGSDSGPQEQRANGFAPSFLVPGPWIEPRTTDPWTLALELGSEWGLSFEGAAWHAKNVGHISNPVAEQLRREPERVPSEDFEQDLPRLPSDVCEPEEVSPLVSGLLSDLVIRAYSAEMITAGRARELLLLR